MELHFSPQRTPASCYFSSGVPLEGRGKGEWKIEWSPSRETSENGSYEARSIIVLWLEPGQMFIPKPVKVERPRKRLDERFIILASVICLPVQNMQEAELD